MQILTIRKVFEALKCKFEPFERDSKHSNSNARTIRKGFEALKCKFNHSKRIIKHSNSNSNHSKGIRSIRSFQMQIRAIRKGLKRSIRSKFEPFEMVFEAFEPNSKHSNAKIRIEIPFERDSKHSNANSNHSKGIRSIQMEMLTTRKVFEAF